MDSELQTEEREVLSSIYDGDSSFKQLSPNTFQYKYGESDSARSFLLEIKWGDTYPEELPKVNMDTFYNKHIANGLKEKVVQLVLEEAQQFLGMSMTYSLFEFVKEKFEDLIEEQPETLETNDIKNLTIVDEDEDAAKNDQKSVTVRKEQLTKAQKRRQWNRVDNKGEKPRGWNWVDIVKHLSQTGSNKDAKED